MKPEKDAYVKYLRRIIPLLFLMIASWLYGQQFSDAPSKAVKQENPPKDTLTIKVAVEEVQVDAVVVDRNGHPITDLTANDFEIYQDGERQNIVSSQYIRYYQPQVEKRNIHPGYNRPLPHIPSTMLSRNAIQRTLVFLVNDLFMSFDDVNNLRMALKTFVEAQMQPGDAVAIMRTSTGNAALQNLTSDKQQLLATIENTRFGNGFFRINPFLPQEDAEKVPFKIHMNAIGYCINAMQDLPGRKFLLLMTSRITLPSCPKLTNVFDSGCYIETYKYQMQANRLADTAWRAGVVIHTLDIRGLSFDPLPSDDQSLLPLSKRTGGLLLMNRNFSVDGIKDVDEEMQGYYLLAYVPPANTFQGQGKNIFHNIQIKTKRPFSEVHARAGFGGTPETLEALTVNHKTPLMKAMFSPFQHKDLKVNLASGFVSDQSKGYVVRAWVHLDGRTLGFIDEKDGSRSVSLEVSAATTDINGFMQKLGGKQLVFRVNNEEIQWIRDHGFRFAISLPTKKPGAYYIRVAARDQATGAMGSAYQFLEIPDLKKKGLELSSIFVINNEEDTSWFLPASKKEQPNPADSSTGIVRKSQALRSYLPGESFEYMTVIYNKNKKKEPLDLESQVVLYRNGEELRRSEAEPIDLGGIKDLERIPIRRKLTLENNLQPGDYVLQLLIRDKQAKEKENQTAQALQFEVSSK
jgi:VWFA-related protein